MPKIHTMWECEYAKMSYITTIGTANGMPNKIQVRRGEYGSEWDEKSLGEIYLFGTRKM